MTKSAVHIRRLFLEPKDTYSDVEAAEILSMELLNLKSLIESGEVEGARNCSGMTVSRKELISFAMDFWPQDAIEEALGDDLAKTIPKLLRLADLHVRIPRFEILALERLAERDGKSVDALLACEILRDVVSANFQHLAAEIPGSSRLFAGRNNRKEVDSLADAPTDELDASDISRSLFRMSGGFWRGMIPLRWRQSPTLHHLKPELRAVRLHKARVARGIWLGIRAQPRRVR